MHWTVPVVAIVLAGLVCGQAAAQPVPPGEPADAEAGNWTVRLDYILWWLRRERVPGVLTIGQPPVTLYGDDRLETRHGDRFNGLRPAVQWLDDGGLGIEGRGFFLERDSTYFKAVSDGDRPLALPFFNTATGRPDSVVVAGLDPRRGLLAGGFVGYSRIEWFGEEVNGVAVLARGESGRLDLLAGARFLQMRDRFHEIATSRTLPEQNVLTGVVDNYRTGNAFYGAQVGLRGEWWWRWLFVRARGTAALGADDQRVRTFGQSVVQTTQARIETARGLYVQASNSGDFSRCRLDGAGEVALDLGVAVSEHVRVLAGYTFLSWFAPLRAGDQVDRVVNPVPGTAPTRPALPFRSDALWAQGLNLGVEVRW
jgi:hypothetical protein